MLAARNGHLSTVKALLMHGAAANLQNNVSRSYLRETCRSDQVCSIFKALILFIVVNQHVRLMYLQPYHRTGARR